MRDAEAGARVLQEQRGPSLATIAELDGGSDRSSRSRGSVAPAGDGQPDDAGDDQRDVHDAGHLLDDDD